jgi:outer membrane protein OmpA-like peptidoglycan-associated protein
MVGNLRMALFPSSGVICSTPQGASLGESQEMRVFFGSKQAGGALTLSLGEQNVGSSYCFGARPSDIQALVASREQYYAELRSPLDGSEVRGQLSEAYNLLDTRTADEVAAARQGSSLTASDLVFNPEGGGAYVRISEGVVAFEGSVADRRAADSLLATLSDVDFGQVEVVDNLELVAASPPPSGHIVTDSILFDVGSADIGEGDQAILDTVADILNGRRSPSGPASAWRVTIVGHTDNTGPREVNQELSFERAQSVREALIQRGVDATALTIAGYGPDQPIADNATEEGQRQNRRIEFVIDEG